MSQLDELFPLLTEGVRQETVTGQTVTRLLEAQRRKTLEDMLQLIPHDRCQADLYVRGGGALGPVCLNCNIKEMLKENVEESHEQT